MEYEETSVSLHVQGMEPVEIPALLCKQDIYLPANHLFDFLKIDNAFTSGADSINGYFINVYEPYSISGIDSSIYFRGKIYQLDSIGLIKTETNLYLRAKYFGEIFGLELKYNSRSLSVTLNTKTELPPIKEKRLEKMRKNLRRINNEIKADSSVSRDFSFFRFGAADWSINSTRRLQSGVEDQKIYLNAGGIIAGGEAKVTANYYSNQPFSKRQVYYSWRYADNENTNIRQAVLGKINAQSTSTLYSPVLGAQFTNAPTSMRRFWGYYTLSDYTDPGWTVELYVNNVQADYVKADASGFFSFKVPLIYGTTQVVFRYYSPFGEERTKSQSITIPYNFLPQNEIEYTVTSGAVEDKKSSFFTRAGINYGVSRNLTIGGGIEYLSSLESFNAMPYLKTSYSPHSSLLLSGEYIYKVRSSGMMNYRSPADLQLELNYTRYDRDQKAILYNRLEERKVILSLPLHFGRYTMFPRLSFNQTLMLKSKYTAADFLLSSYLFGISANFSVNLWVLNSGNPMAFSSLALSYMLPQSIIVSPQIQYDYKSKRINSIRCGIEKRIYEILNMKASFENNFAFRSYNIQFGLQFDLPFMRNGSTINYNKNTTSIMQSANGSLMYDGDLNHLTINNRTSVGRCGIVIGPFLDIDGDGLHDLNEPKVAGVRVNVNGGRMEYDPVDTTARIYDLEPYRKYYIRLSPDGFDNVAWQMKNPSMDVVLNPNGFKLIEVPVSVLGEVSGKIYLNSNNGRKGLGGIYICIYSIDSTLAARVLSEGDGFFSYLGLKPGTYTARVDAEQLTTLKMFAVPEAISFTVRPIVEGDVIDGLEFTLERWRWRYKPLR